MSDNAVLCAWMLVLFSVALAFAVTTYRLKIIYFLAITAVGYLWFAWPEIMTPVLMRPLAFMADPESPCAQNITEGDAFQIQCNTILRETLENIENNPTDIIAQIEFFCLLMNVSTSPKYSERSWHGRI